MTTAPTTILHDSVEMPMHGLGVFRTGDGNEVRNAVTWAIEDGYRLIDTAAIYRNETGVGRAVAAVGVPREDLFITTKLWNTDQGYESTLDAMSESLDKLGMIEEDARFLRFLRDVIDPNTDARQAFSFETDPSKDLRYS